MRGRLTAVAGLGKLAYFCSGGGMTGERLVGAIYVAVSASAFGAMAIFARYAYGSGAD